jgi:oligopeptide/dipeptide ABC transporter ATP-binding protein
MTALLQVENLRTWFHTTRGVVRAVDGVSFSIDAGRTLGLVGESGSGKSVTALSIMRLIDPPGQIEPGSRVLLDGIDLATVGDVQLQAIRGGRVAMIFQEPMTSLNPLFRIGNQIEEAVRTHEQVSTRQARARALEMLQLVGIPDAERRLKSYPHELSGGMRQRVMIAMAMSCGPRLLIADEPTTALDVTIQAQVLQLMRDLRARTQMSILIITHDLGVIAELAHDVAVMYGGEIVEYGPVVEVLKSPQHPYTEALLQSIPKLGMTQAKPLKVIPGVVPNPLRWPRGCRFAPRCDYPFDRCSEHPPLFDVQGRKSACWLCEAGPRTERVPAPEGNAR